jgi:hypothetical protein
MNARSQTAGAPHIFELLNVRHPIMFHFVRETRADSLSSCWIRCRAARHAQWNIADYPKVLWRGPMPLGFHKPEGLTPGFAFAQLILCNTPELKRGGTMALPVAKELNIA